MKKKKYFALLCTAALIGALACGCGSTETETETTATETTAEAPQPMTMGEITAIDGTTVTLELRGGRGGMGGKMGERPEMPEGEAPERPEGEMPEAETITVDLSAFDNIDVADLAVGDMLSLEMDADGNVTAIEKADLSQMPEMPQDDKTGKGKSENQDAE